MIIFTAYLNLSYQKLIFEKQNRHDHIKYIILLRTYSHDPPRLKDIFDEELHPLMVS